jgi:hypothetical protein
VHFASFDANCQRYFPAGFERRLTRFAANRGTIGQGAGLSGKAKGEAFSTG